MAALTALDFQNLQKLVDAMGTTVSTHDSIMKELRVDVNAITGIVSEKSDKQDEQNDKIKEASEKITRVVDKLSEDLVPIIGSTTHGVGSMSQLQKAMEQVEATMQGLSSSAQSLGQSKAVTEHSLRQSEKEIRDLTTRMQQTESVYLQHKASMDATLATMQAANMGGSSNGGGGGSRTPHAMVTNKLLLTIEKLTGEESFDAIDDWYKDIQVNVEELLPT